MEFYGFTDMSYNGQIDPRTSKANGLGLGIDRSGNLIEGYFKNGGI